MHGERELRLVPWQGGSRVVHPTTVSVRTLLDSLYLVLEEVDDWDEERLELHRTRLEAAEEDLLGVIQVGVCKCGRDTLAGSPYCTRHQ